MLAAIITAGDMGKICQAHKINKKYAPLEISAGLAIHSIELIDNLGARICGLLFGGLL